MNADEKEKRDEEEKKKRKMMQKVAVYTGIPMTLLSGLFLGYLIGSFLERRFPSNNIILAVFVMLGVAAGFKLVIDYIRKFG